MTNSDKARRGIYLLPNLFTTGAMFAGFYSVVSGINGDFMQSAIAIFVAGLLDGLDGRIARLTNTQSEFGVQYDSLSDLMSFGVAPSLLAYQWSMVSMKSISAGMGKLGWLIAFMYMACAALRLARFNTQVGVVDKNYFQGLASPAAAGAIASWVWMMTELGLSGSDLWIPTTIITGCVALLMVSNVRYPSFKNMNLGGKVPFVRIFLVVLIFILLSLDPPKVLFGISATYICMGLITTLTGRKKRSSQSRRKNRENAKEKQHVDGA
ncbi:MAG: CDP-diacylglycerol--serine O-phosphatidyltransferase [bacterium]